MQIENKKTSKGEKLMDDEDFFTHDSVRRVLSSSSKDDYIGVDIDRSPVIIGSNCYIGVDSLISMGSVIGHHVVVGFNSFVKRDSKLDDYGIYVGCPVRKVGDVRDKYPELFDKKQKMTK